MPRAQQLLTTLDSDLDKAVALVDAVRALRLPPAAGGGFRALPNFQVALIAELSFLRCFLAWEVFLEEIFLSYAQGKAAPGGTVFPSYVAAPTQAHLRDMLRGERRPFVSWSNPTDVTRRAGLYLKDGEPFQSALATISTPLNDMITVRNRIAHRSGTAATRFLALVRQRHGSVQPGMSPGRFLLAPGTNPASRRLDEYVVLLKTTARAIAP